MNSPWSINIGTHFLFRWFIKTHNTSDEAEIDKKRHNFNWNLFRLLVPTKNQRELSVYLVFRVENCVSLGFSQSFPPTMPTAAMFGRNPKNPVTIIKKRRQSLNYVSIKKYQSYSVSPWCVKISTYGKSYNTEFYIQSNPNGLRQIKNCRMIVTTCNPIVTVKGASEASLKNYFKADLMS